VAPPRRNDGPKGLRVATPRVAILQTFDGEASRASHRAAKPIRSLSKTRTDRLSKGCNLLRGNHG